MGQLRRSSVDGVHRTCTSVPKSRKQKRGKGKSTMVVVVVFLKKPDYN